MLAQGREAKVTRFLHASSVHDVKRGEDGNVGSLCLFSKTAMENFWPLESTSVARVFFYVDSSFMQSLLVFCNSDAAIDRSIDRDSCKFLFEVEKTKNVETTMKLNCIVLLFVNRSHWYVVSHRDGYIDCMSNVFSLQRVEIAESWEEIFLSFFFVLFFLLNYYIKMLSWRNNIVNNGNRIKCHVCVYCNVKLGIMWVRLNEQ